VIPADPELPLGELRAVFGIDAADPDRVHVTRVYEPVASASAGIWRVTIDARDASRTSAILKVVGHSGDGHPNWRSGTDPTHWYYWRREVLAYETGLLESFAGEFRAPACYLVGPRNDGRVALWLEDVQATPATDWSLEDYGAAARHLGHMQGEFAAGRAVPDHEWLSHGWLRSYLDQRDGDRETLDNPAIWNDALLAPYFSDPPVERLRAMRDDQDQFLGSLAVLPRTLCHLDLHPANLFGDTGGATIAIDWAFMGIGAIGEDAGNLVPDAVLDCHVDPRFIDDLYEIVSGGYLSGLRDAGWSGPASDTRLGMAATIAAKYAWIGPAMLRAVAEGRAELNRRPIAESLTWWAPTVRFLLDRADEARSLARDGSRGR
jgi:hypothetical protein